MYSALALSRSDRNAVVWCVQIPLLNSIGSASTSSNVLFRVFILLMFLAGIIFFAIWLVQTVRDRCQRRAHQKGIDGREPLALPSDDASQL